jgi:16S rRNA (guanine1207-N2)-methyltransferase
MERMKNNDTEHNTPHTGVRTKRKTASRATGKKARSKTRNTAVAETLFASPFGSVSLQRYPCREQETLRAWDAADVYCLDHLGLDYLVENETLSKGKDTRILIFNDAFGGLSIPLHDYRPTVIADSFIATQGIRHNMVLNDIAQADIRLCNSLQDLGELYPDGVDIVLIKIPKNNAMLDYQLHQLREVLRADSVVIAAGMTRHIHNSTMDAFTNIIGDTHSTLAKKKARLILSKPDMAMEVSQCEFPVEYEVDIQLPGDAGPGNADRDAGDAANSQTISLINHAAVFSATRPDLGTQLFLQHIASDNRYRTIVDLGCGNGLLGIHAALLNPEAKLVFTDESYMAVDSAMSNFIRQFGEAGEGEGREAEFLQTDCLQGVDNDSADLVLCNPPFHQNNIITDSIAWRMFSESRDVLRKGGELWVVGNRHLAYHAKLKHLFGNCETVASDKRFSLVRAVKKSG